MIRPKFLCCLSIVLLSAAIGCKSHRNVEEPAADRPSAASYISQADQKYAQREDLTRLQEGIVLLRQALTAAPDNYDAAGGSLSSITIWHHIHRALNATRRFVTA